MRKLLLFVFLCCAFFAHGQTGPFSSKFVLITAFGSATVLTDSTWSVQCSHPGSQLGQGYLPTGITAGFLVFDGVGRRYRVKSLTTATFGTSTVVLAELQDQNVAPLGVGVIYDPPDNGDLVLIDVEGNSGLAPSTIARMRIHNVLNIPGQDSTRLEQDSILVYYQGNVEIGRDTISGLSGSGGGGVTSDGVAVSGTYSDITEQISISVDNASDFDIDLINVATDAAQADSMQVIRDSLLAIRLHLSAQFDSLTAIRNDVESNKDSVSQHRVELDNLIDSIAQHRSELDAHLILINTNIADIADLLALVDTLQHVFEIATVADTVTIPDPKEGYQAITTETCAVRLLYTGAYWHVLQGVVPTSPNVLSSSFVGQLDNYPIPTEIFFDSSPVDSVVLESFKLDNVELLPERYVYSYLDTCVYTSLETLLTGAGGIVTDYENFSTCSIDDPYLEYYFILDNFDSVVYVINTDGVLDTVTIYQSTITIDTFQVVLSASSVAQVESISDNNSEITSILIDSVLTFIVPENATSKSVTVTLTYCNNTESSLSAFFDIVANTITLIVPALIKEGTANSVPTYSTTNALQDPALMTLVNNRATMPREQKHNAFTNANRPSAGAGLFGYNSDTGFWQGSSTTTWYDFARANGSNIAVPSTRIVYGNSTGISNSADFVFDNAGKSLGIFNGVIQAVLQPNYLRLAPSSSASTKTEFTSTSIKGAINLIEGGSLLTLNVNGGTRATQVGTIVSSLWNNGNSLNEKSCLKINYTAGGAYANGSSPFLVGPNTLSLNAVLTLPGSPEQDSMRFNSILSNVNTTGWPAKNLPYVYHMSFSKDAVLTWRVYGTGDFMAANYYFNAVQSTSGRNGQPLKYNSTTDKIELTENSYGETHSTATNTYNQTGAAIIIDTLTSTYTLGTITHSAGAFQTSDTKTVQVNYSLTADLPTGETAKNISLQLRLNGSTIQNGCNVSQYLASPDQPQNISCSCTFSATAAQNVQLYISSTGLYKLSNISFQIKEQ